MKFLVFLSDFSFIIFMLFLEVRLFGSLFVSFFFLVVFVFMVGNLIVDIISGEICL